MAKTIDASSSRSVVRRPLPSPPVSRNAWCASLSLRVVPAWYRITVEEDNLRLRGDKTE